MRAEILTIGDELLRGEIVDTNKALLSERLLGIDVETRFQTSVGDDPEEMADAFRRAASRADVVLVSGGLGPTRDDLTAEVLGRTFGRPLRQDAAALETIRAFFRSVGRETIDQSDVLQQRSYVVQQLKHEVHGQVIEAILAAAYI